MSEEILKTGSCPSLSGQSTLTYSISCKGREVYFSLVENSMRGMFSKESISLKQIILELSSVGKPVTSGLLNTLYKGKSINSGGFLLAVLRYEGLVQNAEGKKRSYISSDPKAFTTAIHVLMDSSQPLPPKITKKQKKETL